MCVGGSYNKADGWCNGDALCPELGPLDFINEDGKILWNHGSAENYDGHYNSTTEEGKIDKSLQINLDEVDNPKIKESDFQGIPGYEVDMGNLNKNKKVVAGPYTDKEMEKMDLLPKDSE